MLRARSRGARGELGRSVVRAAYDHAVALSSVGIPAQDVSSIRRVRLLSWLSLGWMTVEGAVGIAAGTAAGSIALIGYGLDSAIEGLASLVVIWRFTGSRVQSESAELRAQKIVAVSFFLLAPYLAIEAVWWLASGTRAQTSWVGIGLAISSVILMPLLGRAKRRLGVRLQSSATAGEGSQNMLCAYLSLAVLLGLTANAVLGAWWADPAVALIVALVAVREGARTWRGEACDDCC